MKTSYFNASIYMSIMKRQDPTMLVLNYMQLKGRRLFKIICRLLVRLDGFLILTCPWITKEKDKPKADLVKKQMLSYKRFCFHHVIDHKN